MRPLLQNCRDIVNAAWNGCWSLLIVSSKRSALSLMLMPRLRDIAHSGEPTRVPAAGFAVPAFVLSDPSS